MKKFLPLIFSLAVCFAVICSVLLILNAKSAGSTQPTTAATQGTVTSSTAATSGTSAPQATQSTAGTQGTSASAQEPAAIPPIYPQAPEGLTEKIYYDFTSDGFSLTKQYCDKNGNAVEEHIYIVDPDLCVLTPSVIATSTFDKSGRMTSSVGRYVKNPFHGEPERKVSIVKSENPLYTYQSCDESGVITLYINEEVNGDGKVIKTEYYTRAGRLTGSETVTYHENGERQSLTALDGGGSLIYSCEYDEKGNFTSAKTVTSTGTEETTAMYYPDGIIKSYVTKTFDVYGNVEDQFSVNFNTSGKLWKYGPFSLSYSYNSDFPKVSSTGSLKYTFDNNGYLSECYNITGSSSSIKTLYSYDGYGRLSKVETKVGATIAAEQVYKYNADGTYYVEIYQLNSYTKKLVKIQVIHGSSTGALTLQETFSNDKRTGYTTYEYDEYNQLVKTQTYTETYGKPNLMSTVNYKYDEHGSITEEKSEGSVTFVHKTYTYFENGKLHEYYSYARTGTALEWLVYEEEGGYTAGESDGRRTIINTFDEDKMLVRMEETIAYQGKKNIYEYDKKGILRLHFQSINGKVVLRQEYDEATRLTTEMTVDTAGNVTETMYEYYANGNKKAIFTYKNDLIQESKEYTENGDPIKIFNKYSDELSYTTIYEYHEDGSGKSVIDYKNSEVIGIQNYRNDGKPTRIFRKEEDTTLDTLFEYYESGATRSVMYYTNEVLLTGLLYNEQGMLDEHIHTDEETGVTTTSKYTRKNGIPTRIDDYVGGEFVGYTLLEYFTYTDDDTKQEKSVFTYDKDGVMTSSKEYMMIETEDYVGTAHVLVKSELFEGGVAVYSETREYEEISGALQFQKITDGDKYTETEFDPYDYYITGNILLRKTYVGGKLVSVYRCTKPSQSPPEYEEDFYGEDGRITHTDLYDTHEPDYVEFRTFYEYHENGVISHKTVYSVRDGELYRLRYEYEYDEAGTLIKDVRSQYDSVGTLYNQNTYEYNGKGQLIKFILFDGYRLSSETFREYHENGKESKKIDLVYDAQGQVINKNEFHYNENGKCIYHLLLRVGVDKQETFFTYDETGRLIDKEYYVDDVLTQKESTDYDENGLVTRKYSFENGKKVENLYTYNTANLIKEHLRYENDILSTRESYEYHKNGNISYYLFYDCVNEQVLDERYYDEDGIWIPTN